MVFSNREIRIVACAACLVALVVVRADDPPKSKATIDPAKLPPGSVIIVSTQPREAFQNVDAIVLSPDEYKRLLAAAEQTRKAADKPETPSVCRLSGRVERRGNRDIAALVAEYRFRTTTPKALVAVGLQKGKPTAAKLDGQLAEFARTTEEGFAVVVDAPGEHSLRIEFEAPVTSLGSKAGERGIDLGLPGSAITTLERLELPAGAAHVRIGGQPVAGPALAAGTATVLGPITQLDVTWDDPSSGKVIEPLVSADAKTDVRIDEKSAVSHTRLTVKVLRGEVGLVTFLAPADAKVTADSALSIEKPTATGNNLWTIRREASVSDFAIDVVARAPATPGGKVKITPISITGASQQKGTIAVSAAPHLRLSFDLPAEADIVRREPPDENPREAIFAYGRIPESGALLEVMTNPTTGKIETQVQHALTLGDRGWRWQGKVELRPIRVEAPYLDMELPKNWLEFRATSADIVESIVPLRDVGPDKRLVRLVFADPRRRPTTIALEAIPVAPESNNSAAFVLPRIVGSADRGGQVSVSVPSGHDLTASVREWDQDQLSPISRLLEGITRNSNQASTATEHSPGEVEVSWRPLGRDVPIAATVQIQLGERQASVRHEWRIPGAIAATAPLKLRGPGSLAGRLRIVAGGRLASIGSHEWTVQPSASVGAELVLVVSYSVPLPATAPQSAVTMPLVWLDQFNEIETTVRVWSGPHPKGIRFPAWVNGPWSEIAPQVMRDIPDFPAMSFVASGIDVPLELLLEDVAGGPVTRLAIDRIWIQALVEDNGRQAYRIRALLRSVPSQNVELELPLAPAVCQFQAFIDGRRLTWTTPDTVGSPRTVRLRLEADASRAIRVLELMYSMGGGAESASEWMVTLVSPRWSDDVVVPAARWQIGFADGRAAVALDHAEFVQQWVWDRGLVRPQPIWTTTFLSRWFAGDARFSELEVSGEDTTLAAVAAAGKPMRFLTVPRTIAWIVCSLGITAIGATFAMVRGRLRLIFGIGVALAAACLALFADQAMSVFLTFAQPGMLMLVLMGIARYLLTKRDRRQSVFLPRGVRLELPPIAHGPNGRSAARRRPEPTTVDAPAGPN